MQKNFLKQIREEKGISSAELARRVGMNKQNLWGFENEKNGVSNEVLQKLAKELGVSIDYIMTGKDSEISEEKRVEKLSYAMEEVFRFYEDEGFNKDTLIKIATELYHIIIDSERVNENTDESLFRESLNKDIYRGLAAKCFLEINNVKR
jgi:transcriptional regulator with XRE-family HTH domain